MANTETGTLLQRVVSDVRIRKNGTAAIWPNESHDHVKTCRFASAVRAQQSNDFASVDVHVDPVDHRPTSINLYQLVSSKDIFGFCRNRGSDFQTRDRRSLADHGFGEGGEVGDGFVSFFVSSFGCWRISVRLGACVVSWLFWLIIMTVTGLVTTCIVHPSCTRGVPVNSTSPVAAV